MYKLAEATGGTESALGAWRRLEPLLGAEKPILLEAFLALLLASLLNLAAPALIGYSIDQHVQTGDWPAVRRDCAVLLALYLCALGAHRFQSRRIGAVGQRVLCRLRQTVFFHLQDLPLAFFLQNQAGDLISRINNDTERLNQFFSHTLTQLLSNLLTMAGAAAFLLFLQPRLGVAALLPAVLLFAFTRALSPWVRARNAASLASVGELSADVAETLEHFKAIVAFHRRDYFRARFGAVNAENARQAVAAGIANSVFTPIYAFCSQMGSLVVLVYGLVLVGRGHFTLGLLLSFLIYVNRFYDPLRHIAALWANLQGALAGWDRISAILTLQSNLPQLPPQTCQAGALRLQFDNVSFGYEPGRPVLRDVTIRLENGKTYAFIGPTGGGKSTTAALMARLYDPDAGVVQLDGCDLRSYTPEQRAAKIGFILQEPFLFDGTVRDNLAYANPAYRDDLLDELGLGPLLERFDAGLDTPVSGQGLSLGQRQIVAFVRAVLRQPDLLILDEATANIDTVTESLLEEALRRLPQRTTRVIVAHRLNTIRSADAIYFVNAGRVQLAGSLDQALELLHGEVRQS
jgi:ATP-binding cassette, subfamily B, bacterial